MKRSVFILALVPSILVLAACTREVVALPTLATGPTPTFEPVTSPTPTLEPPPTVNPTLTLYEKFATRANGICKEANEQVSALSYPIEGEISRGEAAGSYQEIAEYLEKFVTIEGTALDQLRPLPPPKEEAEIFGEYLSALGELIELVREEAADLRAGNLAGYEGSIQRGHAVDAEMSTLAGQAGIRHCGLMRSP